MAGTVRAKVWTEKRAGNITDDDWHEIEGGIARSFGTCMVMGTAATMMAIAEALGLTLPGFSSIPAPDSNHSRMCTVSGRRIVDMVWEDLKPSKILTKAAFENAIVVNSAIGGSTNAPIHLNAIAAHIGVELTCDDWERVGYDIPLIVNMQPAGEYLGEEYYRAGGVPAVVAELAAQGKINGDAIRGSRPWTTVGTMSSDGDEVRFVRNAGRVYAFILSPGRASTMEIKGLDAGSVVEARLLGSHEQVAVAARGSDLQIQLPDRLPSEAAVTVDLGTEARMRGECS